MTDFYGSVDGVTRRTGTRAEDLGFDADESSSDDAFEDFVEELLSEATDLMDRQMHKSYLDEIPAGLNGVANDLVADALRRMVQSRQTPVVRIDDFAVQIVQSVALSPDIVKRLKLYADGGGVRSLEIGQDSLAGVPDSLTAAQLNVMDDLTP